MELAKTVAWLAVLGALVILTSHVVGAARKKVGA